MMRADKPKSGASGMPTRQKLIGGVFVLILLFVGWQVVGMFGGGASTVATAPGAKPSGEMNLGAPGGAPPMPKPKPAALNPALTSAQSQSESALMQLQQDTEAKYISALNELQQLKLSRDIAVVNQAIVSAKLATVTAEKQIVTLLQPEAIQPGSYARGLVNPAATATTATTAPQAVQSAQTEANYSVISVTELQNKWQAVIGYQGSLFQVSIGDLLPADLSKVIQIDKTGVILEKSGVRKKISLVSII